MNDPATIDLNQSWRDNRCSSDPIARSTNRHATTTLYSQSSGISSDQRKIPSTELPRIDGDMADQQDDYRKTLHKMRNPTVDPRKSRRHGTDFGLNRHAESSSTVLNSDHQNPSKAVSVSAPVTIMQDNTDGDSVSSLFECSALDFPQPPPIGSPVIRRMRSSPWFSDKDCMDESFSNKESRRPGSVLFDSDFCSPCYSVSSFLTQQPTMRQENLRGGRHDSSNTVDETTNAEQARLHLSPYLDPGFNGISLEMVGEALVGLDMNALVPQKLFLDKPAHNVPSCEFSQASDSGRQFARSSRQDWSTPSDLLRWSTSHRNLLAPVLQQCVSGEDTLQNDHHGNRTTFRSNTKPALSLPSEHQGIRSRIIRKVASMRSDTRRPDDSNCIPLGSMRPRIISKSRSLRLLACEAGNNLSSSKDRQDLKCPFSLVSNDSLRSFEHCKGRGIQHMSLPSSGLGSLGSEATQHKCKVTALRPMALSSPFVHRETGNRPLAKTRSDLSNGPDKSFIDITPNQGTKHERSAAATKRARVKKFIARASKGIIGWGRQLTRKNSSVK